ncbi:MAG: CbtA family protein [Solirubrobacteraceae bacterium]
MVRSLLIRGMLVGLAAGLLAFPVAYTLGEPPLQAAIDFEERNGAPQPGPPVPEVVSRDSQRTIGLLSALIVMGVALGGLFALVFAWAYGRIGAIGARMTAVVLALGAYLTIIVVPFAKYPATPPATGAPETLGTRTALFVAMITISLVALVAAGRLRRELLPRLGPWNAAIAAAGSFVALIVIAQLVLPAVNETPAGFPADVMWEFRLASLAISATVWATLGLGFGVVAQRLLDGGAVRGAGVAGRA